MDDKKIILLVGSRIRAVRRALGITQKQLAKETGINAGYLSEIENGKKINPGFEVFYRISNQYRVSLDYLVHGIGNMFLPGKQEEENGRQGFVEEIQSIDDLFWLMEHSKMFNDIIMGYAAKTLFENEEIIKKSIERFISKKGMESPTHKEEVRKNDKNKY